MLESTLKLKKLLAVMVAYGIGSIVIQTCKLGRSAHYDYEEYIAITNSSNDSFGSYLNYKHKHKYKHKYKYFVDHRNRTIDIGNRKDGSFSSDDRMKLQPALAPHSSPNKVIDDINDHNHVYSLQSPSTLTTSNNNNNSSSSNNSNNPFQSATECRNQIENQHDALYDTWLSDQVPILHYATTINETTYVLFITSHLQEFKHPFHNSKWYCSHSSSSSISSSSSNSSSTNHTNVEEDEDEAVEVDRSGRSGFIVVKCKSKHRRTGTDTDNDTDTKMNGGAYENVNVNIIHSSLPSNRTGEITYYNISSLLHCDELEEKMHMNWQNDMIIQRALSATRLPSSSSTELSHSGQNNNNNNNHNNNATLDNEHEKMKTIQKQTNFGACTMIQGSTSHERLHQWIEYHRMIGIEHFWIFINEPWSPPPSSSSSSSTVQSQFQLQHLPYITFIPYNFDIKPHYNYTTYRHTFIFIQVPMQMQCIYMMKKYNLEWVTTTDVDEYILVTPNSNDENENRNMNAQTRSMSNLPATTNYTDDDDNDNNDNYHIKNNEPELQRLVNSIVSKHENIGGLCLNSIPFGRNVSMEPKKKTPPFPLLIDYIWRDIEDPSMRPFRHYKFIYNARYVIDLGVHYLYRSSNGRKELRLDVKDQARINHYKNPDDGVYMILKKYDRYTNDTILFDRYRQRLVDILAEEKDASNT